MPAITACGAPGLVVSYDTNNPVPAASRVITELDSLAAGQQQASEFMASLAGSEGEATRAAVARAAQACLRVEVRTATQGSSYQASRGSGVLMRLSEGGPLLVGTAGHVVMDQRTQIRLTRSGGERLEAAVHRQQNLWFGTSDQDWALVEVQLAPEGLTGLPVQLPEAGEIAFVLGYPANAGRDRAGRIVYGDRAGSEPLAPLLTVAQVTHAAPLQLRPLAGCLLLDGCSGGAIVNRRGELIGLFNAVMMETETATATYWLRGASVGALLESPAR